MDPKVLLDVFRAIHLTGLACGFGLALFTDIRALKTLYRPMRERDIELMQTLHLAVAIGLCILWGSGLALLAMRTGFDPALFTPKLIMKLLVVLLLTLNAVLIGNMVLPAMIAKRSRSLAEFPLRDRAQFGLIAGISFSCWASALALGVFSQMKPMGFGELWAVLGPIYLAGCLGATAVSTFAPLLSNLTFAPRHRQAENDAFLRRLGEPG